MDNPTFVGVKNVSGADRKVSHGGNISVFKKDEVQVIEAGAAQFLLSRVVHGSMDVPGVGQRVTVKNLFASVPLAEALKHVKAPENKSIAEAKKRAEAEEEKEVEITDKGIARLKAEGWKAPEPAKKPQVP